jgi:hypothetical protein
MAAEDEKVCVICLDKIKQKYYLTNCKHKFHEECFNNYLNFRDKDKSYINCPVCRTELDIETDEDKGDYMIINEKKIKQLTISKKKADYLNKKLNNYIKEQIDDFDIKMEDIDCDDFITELKMLQLKLPFKIDYELQRKRCLEHINKK